MIELSENAGPITPHKSDHARQSAAPCSNSSTDSTDECYLLSSGRIARFTQKRIIRHLLENAEQLESLAAMERLELAGTDAIRALVAPYKNPLQYICELRRLNGDDCLFSFEVGEARASPHGKAPVYYCLSLNTRTKWRRTLDEVLAMRSYLAHDKKSGAVHGGGRSACLHWAFEHVKGQPKAVVNILLVRHKSPARVIAEVSVDGGVWIFGGRTVDGSQLNKLLGRAAHG